jgi:N utilization substance protein B
MTKTARRRARQAALQILYQWEVGGVAVDRAAATFFDLQWPGREPADPAVRDFASSLALETVASLGDVDPLIAATAERWRIERMPVIDRLILRLAICELRRDDRTPPAIVINEALELARTFSTEEAVKFINAMLDAVRKKLAR